MAHTGKSQRRWVVSAFVVATLVLCAWPKPVYANSTALINQPMPGAVVVNIYWDSNWDADNPTIPRALVDANMTSLTESTYFAPLSEYGVRLVSFGGSFLPNKNCPSVAPTKVGFYDPINTSIAGFVQCEHDNEPRLQGNENSTIYNIILPQSSIESDYFSTNFCGGPGTPAGWHYHGLEKISVIPWNLPFADGPIYSIINTNPQCLGTSSPVANFFREITHEIVESLTDPYPVDISIIPPHIQVAAENEIADLCQNTSNSTVTAFTGGGLNQLFQPIQGVSTYWSNAGQQCLPASISANMVYVAIKMPDGIHFLTAINNGGIGKTADPGNNWPLHTDVSPLGVGAWEHFTLVFNSNGSVSIKTANGQFLTAVNGGGIGLVPDPNNVWPLHTDSTSVGLWERFVLIPQPDGSVEIAMFPLNNPFNVHFLTAVRGGGIGLSADPGNKWPLHTDASTAGQWEMFTLVRQ